MKLLASALLSASIMTFSQVSAAKLLGSNTIDMHTVPNSHLAVVSPGTRLVQGDASQNEFYIIGTSATPTSAPAPASHPADVAKIQVAISETLHQAGMKKGFSKVKKVALHPKKQKLAKLKSKTPSHVKISLNQKHRKAKTLRMNG